MGQGMVDLEGTVKEPSDEEDEDNIDQFNDDTFGPGALDEDWEAAHERLAGLRLSAGGHCMFNLGTNDEGYELGEAELEESLSKLVLEEDLDDTAVVASRKQLLVHPINSSIWDEAIVRAGKAMSADEVRQSLLNRAPPPRSTSPVFGSPPVHTAPIGTPPKYPPHPQQVRAFVDVRWLQFCLVYLFYHLSLHLSIFFPVFVFCTHLMFLAGRLSPSQFSCLPTVLPSPLNPLSPLPHKLLPGCRPHLIHPYVRPPQFMSPPAMHFFVGGWVGVLSLFSQCWVFTMLDTSQQNGVATGCHPPGTGCPSSFDPYANLMTQREKEWVVRIQMLQLQSGGSGVNDYYYKMYFERLERRAMAGDATSGGISKKREPLRLITPQVALAEHTYTPSNQVFYTVGSYMQSVLTKQIWTSCINDFHSCINLAWEEGFVTMMTVRKGRRLIGRMLPFLLASQQAAIVIATANHITHVVRKDSADEVSPFLFVNAQIDISHVLLPFLPAFSLALGAQSLPTLTTVLEILTRGTASSLCLTNRVGYHSSWSKEDHVTYACAMAGGI
uniref:Uncharacterized protein n=1 Tax=Eptatretus burgeri TaxID=7764 RepID=A0A8C4QIC6_EPTBU